MKKLSFLDGITILERNQQKRIFGGEREGPLPHLDDTGGGGGGGGGGVASATANCGGGESVTCNGTYGCTATDYVGCSCDDGSVRKDCAPA